MVKHIQNIANHLRFSYIHAIKFVALEVITKPSFSLASLIDSDLIIIYTEEAYNIS